jgi:Xaa-Pro dipeptidase
VEELRERQARVASHLRENGIFALVLEDFEGQRSRSVRYLSGHPMDAILFVFPDGRTVLVPWDLALARERAGVDRVIPYADFKRSFGEAVAAVLKENGLKQAGSSGVIEISARAPYSRFKELEAALAAETGDARVLCDPNGIDSFLASMRAVKNAGEISRLRKAAEITNDLIRLIEERLRAGRGSLNELELAHFVEREALSLGAEGLGFETLAAGPARSWGIHAFPSYTGGAFGGEGLSILDFGVKVDGYSSDVTITVARGHLAPEQERMIALVQKAYDAAVKTCRPNASTRDPALAAEEVFASGGWAMPHALGHGIGLDAHERPLIRVQGTLPDARLLPGMAFTIEPGLYHPAHGGVRLENDFLVSGTAVEPLTASAILRLD